MSHHRSRAKRFYLSLRARPRLLLSLLIFLFVFFLAPNHWRPQTCGLVAWDVAVFFYLGLAFRLAETSDPERIRHNARVQDDGAITVLFLSALASLACFVAIAFELAVMKSMDGANRLEHLALVGITIPMAWVFIHTMFALHYAHEYYDPQRYDPKAKDHGLEFPEQNLTPNYWDFLYFSMIIGTSGQTADVSISSPYLRKIALLHCVMAFFFNMGALGLTVNVASSLL